MGILLCGATPMKTVPPSLTPNDVMSQMSADLPIRGGARISAGSSGGGA